MPDERIGLVISAKDQASSVLGKVQGAVIGIGAAYLSWQGVSNVIGGIVNAAADEERQWIRVAAALRRHGGELDLNLSKIQEMTNQLERQTGVSDELIAEAYARATTAGWDFAKATAGVQLAMDIAAVTGDNLVTTMESVIKGASGSEMMLNRLAASLGITVTKGATAADTLEKINKQVDGAAKANLEGYAKATSDLAVQWERFQESTGKKGLPTLGKIKERLADLLLTVRSMFDMESLSMDELLDKIRETNTAYIQLLEHGDDAAAANMLEFTAKLTRHYIALQEKLGPVNSSIKDLTANLGPTAEQLALQAALVSNARVEWEKYQKELADVRLIQFRAVDPGKALEAQNAAEEITGAYEDAANTVRYFETEAQKAYTAAEQDFARMGESFDNAFVDVALNSAYRFASTVNDVLWGMEATAADVFRAILKDFTEILLNQLFSSIALSLVGAVGGGGILGALTGGVLGKTAVPAVAGSGGGAVSGNAAGKVVVQQFYGVTSGDFINKDVLPSVSLASKRRQITVQSTNNIRFGMSKVFR